MRGLIETTAASLSSAAVNPRACSKVTERGSVSPPCRISSNPAIHAAVVTYAER
jgi:hypothetical protein